MSIEIENSDKTISDLLRKYPNGFSVSPGGKISKILLATSHFIAIAREYPVTEGNQGYLVVDM